MLSNILNTNEIKNAAGAEVEFQRLSMLDRSTEFAVITEAPNLPHRLYIKHDETGVGIQKKRRSVIGVTIAQASSDAGSDQTVQIKAYFVLETPLGQVSNMNTPKDAMAELGSFIFTTDGSTFLPGGTGTGAAALLSGSL